MPANRLSLLPGNISFNAQHSPMGAFMSFTCGHFGTRGGLAAQAGCPAGQDLYIGVKDGDRFEDAPLKCLPFFKSTSGGGAGAADYLVDQAGPAEQNVTPRVIAYSRDQIRRTYGWATDSWATDDFKFSIYTPFGEIPDPAEAEPSRLREALLPAIVAELEVDNTHGTRTRTAFFAMNFNQPGWRPIDATGCCRKGFGMRRELGILGEVLGADSSEPPALFCRWAPDTGLAERVPHQLGSCPGLLVEVLAGQKRTLRLAIGCYLDGIVTTGLEGRYLYTRYFSGLDDVLSAALDRGDPRPACDLLDQRLLDSGLSADQQFLVAHATRSYYGSTQLLDISGQPFWVVNEGEYCMMNTLDLSVDQMFWEMEQNPWVVRNLLDNFVRHYSYVDRLNARGSFGVIGVAGPGARPHGGAGNGGAAAGSGGGGGGGTRKGGLSFTHDMGAHNNFSPRGHSSYELPDLNAVCFSYMTAEQLCNWILMAATYVTGNGDVNWARQNGHLLLACLESLSNRGGENGIPEYDSSRCGAGAEITTYDSLDHSLAQTRNNLYMAVKFWAAFVGLSTLFQRLGERERSAQAMACADRAAKALLRHAGPDGVIPAVFEKDNGGYRSRILPACEGLLYPHIWGIDVAVEAPALHAGIRRHIQSLLSDPQRRNFFRDGGIKLSSTSSNSWMSKIALFQEVARKVLRLHEDPAVAGLFERADAAHVRWQIEGSGYWACSDQFVDGVAKGSRYYPRIITTALWLDTAVRTEQPAGSPAVANPPART